MITLEQFWKGRDKAYAKELTPEIITNAKETLRRANLLLDRYEKEAGVCGPRGCTSGWRPAAVNAATPRAAKKSNHMLAKAIDIADATGNLDKWLMTPAGQKALVEIGLWMEHPSATPGWAHVQTAPPGSGNRVFYP